MIFQKKNRNLEHKHIFTLNNTTLQHALQYNYLEMLKNTEHKLRLALLKLFNLVLSVGKFPEAWNRGLITPIFKSGDKSDPNNYRGICVSSSLGKLFCSIINTRLVHFLTDHNVLSKSQIGFLPNYRTIELL